MKQAVDLFMHGKCSALQEEKAFTLKARLAPKLANRSAVLSRMYLNDSDKYLQTLTMQLHAFIAANTAG